MGMKIYQLLRSVQGTDPKYKSSYDRATTSASKLWKERIQGWKQARVVSVLKVLHAILHAVCGYNICYMSLR